MTSENVDQLEGALQRYPSLTDPLLAQLVASDHTLAAQLLTRMQASIQPHTLRCVLIGWLLQEPLASTSPAFLQVFWEFRKLVGYLQWRAMQRGVLAI